MEALLKPGSRRLAPSSKPRPSFSSTALWRRSWSGWARPKRTCAGVMRSWCDAGAVVSPSWQKGSSIVPVFSRLERAMPKTTIQIHLSTRKKLARLKASAHETYDGLLNELMALVPQGDEEGLYTPAFRRGLLRARREVKEGRVISHEEMRGRSGLSPIHHRRSGPRV